VAWYLQNHLFTEGQISINGTSQARVGTYVYDKPAPNDKGVGLEFYVEGVSHSFVVFTEYVTRLTVTRGQPRKEDGGLHGQGAYFKQRFYFDEALPSDYAIPPEEKRLKSRQEAEKKKEESIRKEPFIRLPDEYYGCGYYYYSPHPEMRYGTASMVEAIKAVGKQWFALHSTRPIGVGDLSLEYGGKNDYHASHLRGTNVDLRPVRQDDLRQGGINWKPPGNAIYSQALTQQMIDLFFKNGLDPLKRALFNDPGIRRCSREVADHDNHLHLEFQG
jgi:hypothetical protein